MSTPIPRILAALEGLVEFHGGAQDEEKPPIEDVNEAERSLMQWANQVNAGRKR